MILVTGHRGFIGQHMTRILGREGLEYVGYDLKDGDDILDRINLHTVIEDNNVDAIIHLAALTGVRRGEDFKTEYIDTNVQGTQILLDMAERHKIKHFIHFSSSSVYGNIFKQVTEDDTMRPVSLYGVTKLASEYLCRNATVPMTIIRPFAVYGENDRPDKVIYRWYNQIQAGKPIIFYGDGSSYRGYTYVGDLVAGVCQILKGKHEGIFNMGGHEKVELGEVLKLFTAVFPQLKVDKRPMSRCDIHGNIADVSKAREAFGYDPKTDFRKKVTEILYAEIGNLNFAYEYPVV